MSKLILTPKSHSALAGARTRWTRLVLALCSAAASAAAWAPVATAQTADIAILGTTVSGSPSVEEQEATALGLSVDVLTEAQWAAMSTADFAGYQAIVLGDRTCTSVAAAQPAIDNRTTWGPAITGNVLIFGSDPAFHAGSGGRDAIRNFINFAAADQGGTGAYITLSCYGDDPEVAQLLEPFGAFELVGASLNQSHVVAEHPALAGLTDAILDNWSQSSHEGFSSWPANFEVLVIMLDGPQTYRAADGTAGLAYTLARGVGLVPSGALVRSRDWGEAVQVLNNAALVAAEASSLDTNASKVAFFAAQSDGVALLDTTDPQNIVELGRYDPPTCDANGIEVTFNADDVFFVEQQSVMHVSAGGCGVHVVDVSDVANPTFLSSYGVGSGSAEAVDVYVGGVGGEPCDVNAAAFSYAAMLDRFEVYDVSDPGNPAFCGSIAIGTGDLGPGPIVAVDFFEETDVTPDASLAGGDGQMFVAVATGDGARVVNVDQPTMPAVVGTYLNTEEPAAFRISQHVSVDDDVQVGSLSGWASGFQLVVANETTEELEQLAHEPTDSAVYASDECNGLFCIAEGQMGLGILNVEDNAGVLDLVRVGDPIPIGPAGAWAWDLAVDDCDAYVVYGDLNEQCVGGPSDGSSCDSDTQCGSSAVCLDAGDEAFECMGGPAAGESCETDAECGGGSVCQEQGGLQIVELPDCALAALQEDPPPDTDGDGVPDALDNCSEVANDQADADLDGYGNVCDADLDNDGSVAMSDFNILLGNWGSAAATGDIDGDGIVGMVDVNLFLPAFGGPPGPSGLACAGTVPCP